MAKWIEIDGSRNGEKTYAMVVPGGCIVRVCSWLQTGDGLAETATFVPNATIADFQDNSGDDDESRWGY